MPSDLDYQLLACRMKSIQHESSLMKDVLRLQRMRIEQLARQLDVEKKLRMARFNLTEFGVCRNCGLHAPHGQVYCGRACMFQWLRERRGEAVA